MNLVSMKLLLHLLTQKLEIILWYEIVLLR